MEQEDSKHWYAFKIFFGKGKPVKAHFLHSNYEYFYDIKKEVWSKTDKKTKIIEVPVVPSLIFLHSTQQEAKEVEQTFLNQIMLYRRRNAEGVGIPSVISDREIRIFRIVAESGIEGLDFYDEYVPKYAKGDKFRVIEGPLKGAEGYVVRIKKDHHLYVCIPGLCAVTTGYIPKAFLEKIE